MKLRIVSALSLALACAASLLGARDAEATPACACDQGPENVIYASAPLNVHVLLAGAAAAPLPTLAPKSGGAPIAVSIVPAGDDAGHVWAVPAQDLAPNTDYVLRLAGGGLVEIHTAAARDTTPPTLAGVSGAAGGFDGACPTQIAAVVQASGLADNTSASWLRVAFDGPGGHHVVLVRTEATQVGKLADGSCGNAPWATETAYTVHASAIDQAGNESSPIGPASVPMTRIQGRGSCLCRAPGAGTSDGGAVGPASLALVALGAWLARARFTGKRAANSST